MKITVLCVGKVKEKFYRDAIDEFSKRLSRYCKLDILEVADEKTTEEASDTEIRLVKEKEGERLLKNIKDDGYVICLCIDGKQLDSEELSEKLSEQKKSMQKWQKKRLQQKKSDSLKMSTAYCRLTRLNWNSVMVSSR